MATKKITEVDIVNSLSDSDAIFVNSSNSLKQIPKSNLVMKGDTGKSAYAYAVEGGYTGTEEEFAAKLAQEKYANPNPLTFTGAVAASYDGSTALTVEIPSGGVAIETEFTKEKIVLNEAVSSIEISIPNAKKVYIYAYLIANDANNSLTTGKTNAKVKVNGELAAYPVIYIRSSAGFYTFFDIEKIGTKTKVCSSFYSDQPTWSYAASIQLNGWHVTDYDTSDTIYKFSIELVSSDYIFPAGCFLEVYYK